MTTPHRLQITSPTGLTQDTTVLLDGVPLCCQAVELRGSILSREHWTARLTVLVKPDVTIGGLVGASLADVLLAAHGGNGKEPDVTVLDGRSQGP